MQSGILISDCCQGDPVQELVQRFMGEAEASKRITLTIEDVPQNPDGVRKLIVSTDNHRITSSWVERVGM